jgi:hypothetical protein
MFLAGERDNLPEQALAGSAAIEASILLWAMMNKVEDYDNGSDPSSDSSFQ